MSKNNHRSPIGAMRSFAPRRFRGLYLPQLWGRKRLRFFCELAGEEGHNLHLTFKRGTGSN